MSLQRNAIIKLGLQHFRNYEFFYHNFDPSPVILVGENGAGKTNILEAISLFGSGRGLRGATLGEMRPSHLSECQSTISTTFLQDSLPHHMSMHIEYKSALHDQRVVELDYAPVKNMTAIHRVFRVLWVTPQMDVTLLSGSTVRRRFWDKMVGIFYPEHSRHLHHYESAMRERIALLCRPSMNDRWLSLLERKMAEHAMAIASHRLMVLEEVQRHIQVVYSPFPKAILHIHGDCEEALIAGKQGSIETYLCDRWREAREGDKTQASTQYGAHRSDIRIIHAPKNMPLDVCSTGEQKALLMTIMLAFTRLMGEKGPLPLLLLDEVAAHLDSDRRAFLAHEMTELGVQAWMTGTERSYFKDFLPFSQIFDVKSASFV